MHERNLLCERPYGLHLVPKGKLVLVIQWPFCSCGNLGYPHHSPQAIITRLEWVSTINIWMCLSIWGTLVDSCRWYVPEMQDLGDGCSTFPPATFINLFLFYLHQAWTEFCFRSWIVFSRTLVHWKEQMSVSFLYLFNSFEFIRLQHQFHSCLSDKLTLHSTAFNLLRIFLYMIASIQ